MAPYSQLFSPLLIVVEDFLLPALLPIIKQRFLNCGITPIFGAQKYEAQNVVRKVNILNDDPTLFQGLGRLENSI